MGAGGRVMVDPCFLPPNRRALGGGGPCSRGVCCLLKEGLGESGGLALFLRDPRGEGGGLASGE